MCKKPANLRFMMGLLLTLFGLFSSKAHAAPAQLEYIEQVEVKCYLVTREQLGEVFSHPAAEVIQLPKKELHAKELFILVRCKNNGDSQLFGTLHCFLPNNVRIPMDILELEPHKKTFSDCAIYVGFGGALKDNEMPRVRYKWETLSPVFSPKAENYGESIKLGDPLYHALFSKPSYAKKIEVKCYLVTRKQLGQFFSNPDSAITQLTNNELLTKEVFLLVRCKNKGNYAAFGTLHCFLTYMPDRIFINIFALGAYRKKFHINVVQVGTEALPRNNKIPQITYKWDSLYLE